MRRFFNQQAIQNLGIPVEYSSFKELLPLGNNNKGDLLNPHVQEICSSSVESLIGPCTDKILPNDIYTELCNIYAQLYSSSHLTFVSRSYVHAKRASIGGELLVASSVNERLSTVAAYWPGMGTSIATFNPLVKRIGKIMYFLKHSVKLMDTNGQYQKTHIFCRVLWYQYHTYPEFFGSSVPSFLRLKVLVASYHWLEYPITAAGEIEIDFNPPLGNDKVFIAIPLTFNFNV